jgi:hypothetical protein
VPLSANTTHDLISRWAPQLIFSPHETSFPIDVDPYLGHAEAEPWDAPGSEFGGTALATAPVEPSFPADFPTGPSYVLAGSPTGARLTAADLAAAPAATDAEDVFIDFAGWALQGGASTPDFTMGDAERLRENFNELILAMTGDRIPPDPNQRIDLGPVPVQPTQPTVFAEVDWAGRFPRLDPTSFGWPGVSAMLAALDNYLCITYFVFFPLTDEPPLAGTVRGHFFQREGQWEAVSVYLKSALAPDLSRTDPTGMPMPDFPDDAEFSLRFLVYSKTVTSDEAVPVPEVRPYLTPDVSRAAVLPPTFGKGGSGHDWLGAASVTPDSNPRVFVTCGVHKLMFEPQAQTTVTDTGPDPGLSAAGSGLGAAGAAATLACAATGPAAVVTCALGVAAVLIGGLLSALANLVHGHTTTFSPTGPENDFVPPNGPASGPEGVPLTSPAMDTPGTPPYALQPFSALPPAPGEEGDALYAHPAWWPYNGRWGVRVAVRPSSGWDSGTRRVDLSGRTKACWNTLEVFRFVHLHPGISL